MVAERRCETARRCKTATPAAPMTDEMVTLPTLTPVLRPWRNTSHLHESVAKEADIRQKQFSEVVNLIVDMATEIELLKLKSKFEVGHQKRRRKLFMPGTGWTRISGKRN